MKLCEQIANPFVQKQKFEKPEVFSFDTKMEDEETGSSKTEEEDSQREKKHKSETSLASSVEDTKENRSTGSNVLSLSSSSNGSQSSTGAPTKKPNRFLKEKPKSSSYATSNPLDSLNKLATSGDKSVASEDPKKRKLGSALFGKK
jgi:hypothetical protein